MKEPNLIASQQDAVNGIVAAREQGPRAACYRMTPLNRNPRVLRGICRSYERHARRMGFRPEQIAAQWKDIVDMAKLEVAAE